MFVIFVMYKIGFTLSVSLEEIREKLFVLQIPNYTFLSVLDDTGSL